jgi:hypothetical protein
MKLFQFSKPVQPRRRRKKKSHKWIDKAKAEVKKMPSLGNLEEDILVKAAILCTAGHYSLKLTDFKWETPEEAAFVQNMIWVIEALQKKYPHYLQYARWVAIKRAIDLIEGLRKGYRKNEDADHRFVAQEVVPPPDIGKVMEEEWDRHWSGYRKGVEISNTHSRLAQFLREFNKMLESVNNNRNQSPDKPAKTIAVDVDGKGTFVTMTPDEYAMWNRLIKQQPPPDKPNPEKDDLSP